jgi:hypothetical protein
MSEVYVPHNNVEASAGLFGGEKVMEGVWAISRLKDISSLHTVRYFAKEWPAFVEE